MLVMPSVDDVVTAYRAIDDAWDNYRRTLRACLQEGADEGRTGRQAELVRRINRTREMLRRDAMTDEQREALKETEKERKRAKAADRGK